MNYIFKKQHLIVFFLCLFSITIFAQKNKTTALALPSFNDVPSKARIIQFVKNITDPTNKDYVRPADRIACFDNDGTLWAEQPLPVQIFFDFDRIKEMAKDHPEWNDQQPYKAVIENDIETIHKMPITELIKIITMAESIDNVDDFDSIVIEWLKKTKSPHFQKPYYDLAYQPMLEVMDLLRKNGFKIYVVSGGSVEFMRPWIPCIYGVPKEQIIGTTLKTEAIEKDDKITIKRLPILEHNDDHFGKPISIEKHIGKKPIIVFGNSDGDLEMMEYASTNHLPHLMVYVNHTDANREFEYSEKTVYGKLVKGLEVAKKNKWLIIEMQKDWKIVFGSPKKLDCNN